MNEVIYIHFYTKMRTQPNFNELDVSVKLLIFMYLFVSNSSAFFSTNLRKVHNILFS